MKIMKKVSHLFSNIEYSSLYTLELGKIFGNNDISGIQLDVKRDDLLHPIISGNKWRKLKYLLLHLEKEGTTKVATMGGAYSNFIHVLSYVCHFLGWQCHLYIRGYSEQSLSPTLQDCQKWGAKLHFVDRKTFKEIRNKPPQLEQGIFWIPEGGMNALAVKGLAEILMELTKQYQYIVIASATGTSVAGLVRAAHRYQPNAKIIGVSVLNNVDQQRKDVAKLIGNSKVKCEIIDGYNFGGFAKTDKNLVEFTQNFTQEYSIPIEPVYSGKSFYAVFDLIQKQYFSTNSNVLLIHCGGLQATR